MHCGTSQTTTNRIERKSLHNMFRVFCSPEVTCIPFTYTPNSDWLVAEQQVVFSSLNVNCNTKWIHRTYTENSVKCNFESSAFYAVRRVQTNRWLNQLSGCSCSQWIYSWQPHVETVNKPTICNRLMIGDGNA